MTHLNADGSVPGESPFFTQRRRQREQMLERVGVGSDTGQKLLERWGREAGSETYRAGAADRVAKPADTAEGAI